MVDIRTPIHSKDEVVGKYDEFLQSHPNVKLAVIGKLYFYISFNISIFFIIVSF